MLSDYIVFWMRHNERPAFALGSFEILCYETIDIRLHELINKMAAEFIPEFETALDKIRATLER